MSTDHDVAYCCYVVHELAGVRSAQSAEIERATAPAFRGRSRTFQPPRLQRAQCPLTLLSTLILMLRVCVHSLMRLQVRVKRVRKFTSFAAMISEVGIEHLLPGFEGDEASAIELYLNFQTTRGSYAKLEAKHGAVAIDIEPIEDGL